MPVLASWGLRSRLPLPTLALIGAITTNLGVTSQAFSAGTAFGVDTAEVGEPGSCKVEAWTSWAKNRDGLVTANPSCILQTFAPTEISTQFSRSRSDDEWSSSFSPKAKFKLLPTAIGSFGYAVVAGNAFDLKSGDMTTVFAYVPATLRLSEVIRINVNAGWQLDRAADHHFATYGLGIDWRMTDTWTLTLETFGLAGKGESSSETRPRFQSGLRYRPIDQFSLDFIYGQNINGENSHWVTFGTTIRFSQN